MFHSLETVQMLASSKSKKLVELHVHLLIASKEEYRRRFRKKILNPESLKSFFKAHKKERRKRNREAFS